MSKLSKVLAVAVIAGSVGWVGHQVARHHHKSARIHAEFSALRRAHNERTQGAEVEQTGFAGHNNNVRVTFENFGFLATDQKQVEEYQGVQAEYQGDEEHRGGHHHCRHHHHRGDDKVVSGAWGHHEHHHDGDGDELAQHHERRHSHDGGRRHHHDEERQEHEHRRHHQRRHSDDQFQGRREQEQQEQEYGVAQSGDQDAQVGSTSVEPEVFQSVNFIRLPANDADSNEVADQVPELEDNDESLSAAGNRRHHAKSLSSAKEAHFREFEDRRQAANDEYTDEERAEWRRLHKEARRLHCDAFRTAGGFVAGAAFFGGFAHLRRLRRERRQRAAAAAAVAQPGNVAHADC